MFVVQRSGDLFLGIPYDVALFTRILLYVADYTGLDANVLDIQIVDAHIYNNQLEAVYEYLKQDNFELPKYKLDGNLLELIAYKHGPVITATVAV
jgi:thymidylate synthase